jgi:hypothetical protein
MAAVAALIPDLLFGSNVVSLLRAAGHETVLISTLDQLEPGTTDVLIVDLTADAPERLEHVLAADIGRARKIAVYAHVEADVRRLAERAGFDLVVPRSRFAREGGALVSKLSG